MNDLRLYVKYLRLHFLAGRSTGLALDDVTGGLSSS